MFDTDDKDRFEEKSINNLFFSGIKRTVKKHGRIPPLSEKGDEGSDDPLHRSIKKMSDKPAPIRENKVKQAIMKKHRGDYNHPEVYEKIADRLMDLFGV